MPNLKLAFYFSGGANPAMTPDTANRPMWAGSASEAASRVVVSSTNIEPSPPPRPDRAASDPADGSHVSTFEVGR